MALGKQIRKRRKELKMSVDELARRIGKDRSTIYRYENGDIGNMPIELLPPMLEALETTPQELLSTIVTSSEWLSSRAESWFDATEGYEFSDKEVELFHEVARYLMGIRNSEDYDENINALFTLFKQLNKGGDA
jgi:transcriptional regulator with XRE-family HTH domain